MAHPIKVFIYHNKIMAKLYNIIRNYRRDRKNNLTDEEFAKWYYNKNTGKILNLESPASFDEKVWFLKLYDKNPLKTMLSDKYEVREYVKKCGLSEILIPVYGVYDDFSKIPFETMPNAFFIKCTHTSGCNTIFDKSRKFDTKYYECEFDFWMKRNYFWGSRGVEL